MRKHLGQVARLPMERVVVEQEDRADALRGTQERGHEQRVCPMQVQIGIAESRMDLKRQARSGSRPKHVAEQDRIAESRGAGRVDLGQPRTGMNGNLIEPWRSGVEVQPVAVGDDRLEPDCAWDGGLEDSFEGRSKPAGRRSRPGDLFGERLETHDRMNRSAGEATELLGGDQAIGLEARIHQQPLEAADLQAELEQWKQAARLYETAGELGRAAEMFQAAGEHVRAGDSYQRAGRHDEAADSYREAGDLPRWVEALEKSGRPYQAAQVAIERGDWGRAIRSLQLVTASDAEYVDAARLLVEAYEREGHLDLATRKVEEVVASKGADSVPIESCDRLARRLEETGDFDRALDVLELIRTRDATWPNVATRIEGLRKRRSGNQHSTAGAAQAPAAGNPFGEAARYEILEELGRGGMGIVFKARDRRLGRIVALKRLPDSLRNHPKAVELFLREARAAAALNHPNIVTLFDAGQDGDAYYITMELLEGLPLQQILRQRGRLGPRDAAKLGLQIANGLHYAHVQRIVHRDIKTGNLFFTKGKAIKIMDFGLAKMVEEVRRASTVIGGTPYYMAPEQSLGEAVDHRADLYALGVTFYELLTGRVPFRDGDVAFHHRHTPVPDPRDFVAEIPPAWSELVLQMLAKSPDDRPESAAAVGERLAPLSQGGPR